VIGLLSIRGFLTDHVRAVLRSTSFLEKYGERGDQRGCKKCSIYKVKMDFDMMG
jgi:hypothetical protein